MQYIPTIHDKIYGTPIVKTHGQNKSHLSSTHNTSANANIISVQKSHAFCKKGNSDINCGCVVGKSDTISAEIRVEIAVDIVVDIADGVGVGTTDGTSVGWAVGITVGIFVGLFDGLPVG